MVVVTDDRSVRLMLRPAREEQALEAIRWHGAMPPERAIRAVFGNRVRARERAGTTTELGR